MAKKKGPRKTEQAPTSIDIDKVHEKQSEKQCSEPKEMREAREKIERVRIIHQEALDRVRLGLSPDTVIMILSDGPEGLFISGWSKSKTQEIGLLESARSIRRVQLIKEMDV